MPAHACTWTVSYTAAYQPMRYSFLKRIPMSNIYVFYIPDMC